MFGFGKRARKAKAELKKMENRDLMEAIVGGSLLVAAADGDISHDEVENLEKLIASNPALEHFGGEIHKTMGRFEAMLDAGFRIGKMKILREIEDIKGSPEDAEEVFITMLTIAEADGEIDEKELAILKEVGQKLGVRLADFDLAA